MLTVNEPYADLLDEHLGVRRPAVVMNCPETLDTALPDAGPDPRRARDPGRDPIVLYQGQLIGERGIEQAMDAILEVPEAVLVLLGFGVWAER